MWSQFRTRLAFVVSKAMLPSHMTLGALEAKQGRRKVVFNSRLLGPLSPAVVAKSGPSSAVRRMSTTAEGNTTPATRGMSTVPPGGYLHEPEQEPELETKRASARSESSSGHGSSSDKSPKNIWLSDSSTYPLIFIMGLVPLLIVVGAGKVIWDNPGDFRYKRSDRKRFIRGDFPTDLSDEEFEHWLMEGYEYQ